MNMNRQTKRMMNKQGANERRAPTPGQQQTKERSTPIQFLSEVMGELRKVAWPTRKEVVTSTIIVLICVSFLTALIAGYDWGSNRLINFLYK